MSPCPSDHLLELLLSGQLAPRDSAAVGPHISICTQCQARLDALTDDTDLGRHATRNDRVPDGALAGLLQRLRQAPPAACGGGKDLRFPGPPSAEAPLGQLGRYLILGPLGGGAGGLLFRARDSRLGRLVAVKVLRPELAALHSARTRFEREARAAGALKHEHIVTVHAAASPPDFLPYLVMELIDGESLADRLQRDGRLAPAVAARVIHEAALGLDAAHRQGLVHRDIKPSNILLEAATGRAKVTDFGLALAADPARVTVTQDGQILGTPAYMSPEQAAGRSHAVDARSDVYGLGAVLYHALTGRLPFDGDSGSLLYQVVHKEPVPPRRLRSTLPRDLETICLKCLQKQPRHRYATAAELAADLQRWLRGEPVAARPVGRAGRALRWCRRNPGLAMLGSAVTVLAVALAVAGTVAAIQDGRRRQAVAQADQRGLDLEHRDYLRAQREKLQTHQRLGQDSLDWGDADKARTHFLNALPLAETLLREDPDNLIARRDLAVVVERLGDVSDELDDVAAARQYYTRWLALVRELVQADPNDEKARWDLCLAYSCLGDILDVQGDTRQAEEMYRQCDEQLAALAQETARTDEAAGILLYRADILADRGQHQAIAAIAEQIRRRAPRDAHNLVDVAGGYAQAYRAIAYRKKPERLTADDKALQKQYADRAFAALREALDRGLDDAAYLQKDPYLKPLRQHASFRKIVNQLK